MQIVQTHSFPPRRCSNLPGARTAPPAVAATPAPTAAAPLASLAELVSSIEIPPEEMAKPDNAVGADTLARLLEEKRKAEAAEAAKSEKEEAAAQAKAEAEAQAQSGRATWRERVGK